MRADAVIQVLEPVYRASNTVWFSVLAILLELVKIILLVPRVISPVKVVAFCVCQSIYPAVVTTDDIFQYGRVRVLLCNTI